MRDFSRRVLVPIGALLLVGCAGRAPEPPPEPDASTRRTIAQGDLVGFVHPEGGLAWRGIPFAEPPLGELRFRAPRPPAPWSGTFEAVEHGASCTQFASRLGGGEGAARGEPSGSEDCLVLDVYAPVPSGGAAEDRAALPVMVWIHGGGNSIGDVRIYDGSVLASRQNVVVVTVQYRLGVFGWFSHPALRPAGSSPDDASGNYGTLDLIRALEWVRDNVGAFGGDPGRVTIFGESAGGANVYSLMLSPRARGLFHRAIAQSGGLYTTPRPEAEDYADAEPPGHERSSREVLLALLQADGTASGRDAARTALEAMSAGEVAAYLRGKPAAEILSVFEGRFAGMYDAPELLRDGHVLPDEDPMELLRTGRYHRVPFISGTNRDEQKLFMIAGSPHVTRFFGVPVRLNDRRLYDLEAEYGARSWKAEAVDEPLELMRSVQGPSVYGYRFDWDDEPDLLWIDMSSLLGAAHGLEIPFVFGRLRFFTTDRIFDESRADVDYALAEAMMGYWTRFAAAGDPGGGDDGTVRWEPWGQGDAPRYLVLDSADDGGIRMGSEIFETQALVEAVATDPRFRSAEERCALWGSFVVYAELMTPEDYATRADGRCADVPLPGP